MSWLHPEGRGTSRIHWQADASEPANRKGYCSTIHQPDVGKPSLWLLAYLSTERGGEVKISCNKSLILFPLPTPSSPSSLSLLFTFAVQFIYLIVRRTGMSCYSSKANLHLFREFLVCKWMRWRGLDERFWKITYGRLRVGWAHTEYVEISWTQERTCGFGISIV